MSKKKKHMNTKQFNLADPSPIYKRKDSTFIHNYTDIDHAYA